MHPLVDYFRCPEHLAVLGTAGTLPPRAGYFRLGDTIAYGRQSVGPPSQRADGFLADVASGVSSADGTVLLPFDLAEVVNTLRFERYPLGCTPLERISTTGPVHSVYYFFRPVLRVGVRKHLQRLALHGWRRIAFPRWPVDLTVETLMKRAVRLVLEQSDVGEFPFIWFWPEGASSCVMMTHDVEGAAGAAFCGELMNLDDRFGIDSAFQVVPDAPWSSNGSTRQLVEQLRDRGYEVNVHDLTHDGDLFRNRELFLQRAAAINARAREFGSRGFRSGAMYRRQDWFAALDFAFDMSVPNVAHLEPQRGGCCTVMPYFLGDVLELPLTTTQDYSLFHVLNDYSTALWKQQIDLILEQNGLISFIVHPDLLLDQRARTVYVRLLDHIAQLRAARNVWVALPSEIDSWWRDRHEMRLAPDGRSWRIEGRGSERARVACARLERGRVVYEVGRLREPA